MALGEYVSVSTQRDTEKALLKKERRESTHSRTPNSTSSPDSTRRKGLSPATARTVAEELTDHDAFAAHVDIELGIDPEELTNPWQAAISSAIAFTVGAILPMLAILLPPPNLRIPITFVGVLIALALTGWLSARLGGANVRNAIQRVVIGGALAMGITFAIGHLVGGAVG